MTVICRTSPLQYSFQLVTRPAHWAIQNLEKTASMMRGGSGTEMEMGMVRKGKKDEVGEQLAQRGPACVGGVVFFWPYFGHLFALLPGVPECASVPSGHPSW